MTEDEKDKKRRKRGVPHIQINEAWCKKCGICVEFCPATVFEARADGFPVIVNADACTWCEMCVLRCPDLAIVLKEKTSGEAT